MSDISSRAIAEDGTVSFADQLSDDTATKHNHPMAIQQTDDGFPAGFQPGPYRAWLFPTIASILILFIGIIAVACISNLVLI
ncbi:hypothetical protein [Aestuariispira insulae]|uniref:hypothetical protein n=1 Tax=Aestuariispira insulae TaxID=1461337 RepID=UPI0011C05DB0|nr:hypothetical protein [Aestuariispira insulae]